MTPEELVRVDPVPLHHRRADARRGARFLRRQAPTRAAREAEMRADGYPGLHDLGRAGSATPTTRSAACAARASPRAGATSRSRSAATWTRTSAASASCARRSATTASSWSTPTRSGTSTRRSSGCARSRRHAAVDRGADQPRRHPGPRPHRARARAARDPRRDRRALPQPGHVQAVPAGRVPSASARSTAAGSAGSTRSWRCC